MYLSVVSEALIFGTCCSLPFELVAILKVELDWRDLVYSPLANNSTISPHALDEIHLLLQLPFLKSKVG